MWALVLKRLQERRDSSKSTEESIYLSEIIDLANTRRLPSDFVASFSEEGDDLSQWRSYCPGEAGFSIGFSSCALRSQWISDPTGGKPSFVGGQLIKVSETGQPRLYVLRAHWHGLRAAPLETKGTRNRLTRKTRGPECCRVIAVMNR
jgi:hypothetical protein